VGAVLSFRKNASASSCAGCRRSNVCSAAKSIAMLHSKHGLKATAPLSIRARLNGGSECSQDAPPAWTPFGCARTTTIARGTVQLPAAAAAPACRAQPATGLRTASAHGCRQASSRMSMLTTEPGDVVFRHACATGLEGIVSKRLGSRYRSEAHARLGQDEEPGCAGVRPTLSGGVRCSFKRSPEGSRVAGSRASPCGLERLAPQGGGLRDIFCLITK
jgi:hypothetical protein